MVYSLIAKSLKERDFSLSLMGKVKEVSAVPSLRIILSKEGVRSWFTLITPACNSFVPDERIIWGDLVVWDEYEEMTLSSKHICLKTKTNVIINESFKIFIKGKIHWTRAKELDAWVPKFLFDEDTDFVNDEDSNDFDAGRKFGVMEFVNSNDASDFEKVLESSCMRENTLSQEKVQSTARKDTPQSNDPFNIYETLHKKKATTPQANDSDLTHPFDFTPEKKNHIENNVISSPDDQALWGNLSFDHAVSSAIQNSGGDFNKVITDQERVGSIFNVRGVNAFNNFISKADLTDILMGGYSFEWSHRSATKMRKLDRFLISKRLMVRFPQLSGLCLDRHLSGHRPIIMYESSFDYGPTLFKKLPLLKSTIKIWVKENKEKIIDIKSSIQHKLSEVEKVIDQGGGNDKILNQRSSLIKYLNDINSINALNLSQKTKVYWSIEGAEFFNHFSNEFSKPTSTRINIDFEFPTWLNLDQVEELEHHISFEEIKKALWNYGTNKSPGPDGFTFEFF
nr:hypothetical protein [Tanacetum cinerariifolium]